MGTGHAGYSKNERRHFSKVKYRRTHTKPSLFFSCQEYEPVEQEVEAAAQIS